MFDYERLAKAIKASGRSESQAEIVAWLQTKQADELDKLWQRFVLKRT